MDVCTGALSRGMGVHPRDDQTNRGGAVERGDRREAGDPQEDGGPPPRHLLEKPGMGNRVELTRYAIKRGLASPSHPRPHLRRFAVVPGSACGAPDNSSATPIIS